VRDMIAGPNIDGMERVRTPVVESVGHVAGIEKKGEEMLSELEVRILFLCGMGDGGCFLKRWRLILRW
jgi:hypothetical protein